MSRRDLITLIGSAPVWPVAAKAQQLDRMRRIGVLMAVANDAPGRAQSDALQQGLASLGWIDGRNLRIDIRWGAGNSERYRALAAELISLSPDVIVTQSNQVTTIVSRQTRRIPIVFAGASDPLETGLISNMARPGGNVTGFAQLEIAIVGKYLELLKEVAPNLAQIAVLYTREGPASARYVPKINALAPSFGVKTTSIPADDADELDRAIAALSSGSNAGLVIVSGPAPTSHREQIFALAARYRLPAIYPYRFYATEGGLMSFGPDIVEQYQRSASYVDRILKGEKPGDLPVQEPTKFELVINLKAAKALGLTVPPNMLAIADEVIE